MDNSKRQRRINEDGDWEYLCVNCENWKPKERFKGCVDKVDGFGNCYMCKSCIASKGNENKNNRDKMELDIAMMKLGYEVGNPDNPVWVQFHKRHNLPY